MQAQIGGMNVAMQNAEDGISIIRLADGALNETQSILSRMRDLAVRASNQATLTTTDLGRLGSEFQSLKRELFRKASTVSFNSKLLFSTTFSAGQALQIGADNNSNVRISIVIATMNSTGLGLTAQCKISTVSFAQSAIDIVDNAINVVSNTRATLGIQERRLGHIIDDLKTSEINVAAAKSRIMDADMAQEVTELTKLQILQQSGVAILGQANSLPQSILKLIG
jgi:flagellin